MGGTVRGEQEQSEGASLASPRRVRTGPRHAAPKKSMLTRLQVPAGKAIALAAMPTAVLMGMGLTPQLAQATSRAEDRYKPGPCVSRSEEADKDDAKDDESTDEADETSTGPEDEGSEGEDSDIKGSEGRTSEGEGKGSDDKETEPGATPTPSASSGTRTDDEADDKADDDADDKTDDATDDATPEKPSASPSPSATETKNPPLDPLGLGDAVKDIVTGGGDDKDEDKTAEPSTKPTPSDSATGSSGKTTDPAKDAADKADKAGKTAEDKAKAEDAEDKPDGPTPSPGPSSSPSPDTEDRDKNGKEPFPCPTFDAEAYENAETDPIPSLLPEEPWILKSSLLTLHGLDYKGIVEVKTYSGTVKKVLKFTATGVDIKDLHQLVKGAGGTTTHVAAREGSISTFSNGPITMYTEELSGNLLGIIPITFSPKSPPPLNLPEVFFTEVTVTQAGQFGGDLTIPGMRLYKTGD